MIDSNDILAKSNDGLDIILYYYPQARDSAENPKKPFSLRGEKTPSAFLKKFGNQWKVTDFGDDAQARSAFDITMAEEGIKFYECICLLADRFGISNTINAAINKPEIRQRAPEEHETNGSFNYEFKKEWTASELDVFGHRVKQEHVDKLSYRSVAWYSKTKLNDKNVLETTIISSTEHYPIFARECKYIDNTGQEQIFLKIYQPLNPDKAFRFFYVGNKPADYVNGLSELRLAYREFNAKEQQIFETNPSNEGKPYKEKKLECACMCSGERDSLNSLSYGFPPLWLNSESATLSEADYREITKLVDILYNIPDIDSTGKRKGIQLGMKYLDIRTVKIPEFISSYKDMRGKPRKDLRDFLDIRRDKREFENILKIAMPYKFWEFILGKNGYSLEINTAYMLNFLTDSGFGKIQDSSTKKETLVQIKGSIVKEVTPKDIRAYLVDFVRKNVSDIKVINLVLNSARTKTVTMDDLNKIEPDFHSFTEISQFMFFQNKSIQIFSDRVVEYKPGESPCHVWDTKVSEHSFKRIDPAFSISKDEDDFDIQINHEKSHYFRYLINASRVHWRTEIELRATGNHDDDQAYFDQNHFNISGDRLTAEEAEEQKLNLISKIFAIGYLMHRYKALSKSWAVWVMEDAVSDDGMSLGGTGKSFMIKFLKNFLKMVTFGGRNKKLTDNQHIFERITTDTDTMFIDDADQYLDFNFFYGPITGDMEKNEKFVKSSEITYEESPKMVVTSNFPPRATDSSTSRRLLYVVFSDWYHEANEDNTYRETRTIHDDFGYDICKAGYKKDYWNEDINFLVDCIQFYLSVSAENIKIQPPMKKVHERMNIATMGNQFREWAEVYFSLQSENIDKCLVRRSVMEDFERDTKLKGWSTKQFSKAMSAFAKNSPWIFELNPASLHNSGKRIVRNIDGKTNEILYVRTIDPETGIRRETNTDTPF